MIDDAYYESAEHHLRNLLAIVHGDGGHHCEEHGMEASTKRAMEIVGFLRNEDNACLRKQILGYRKDLEMCRKVLYYILSRAGSSGNEQSLIKIEEVAERALKEMKQK